MNSSRIAASDRINSLIKGVFTNWHFMRWLRLGLGLFLLWQVIQKPDLFTGFVAAFFLIQAVADIGCCGAGGCSIPSKRDAHANSDEVTCEDVNRKSKLCDRGY